MASFTADDVTAVTANIDAIADQLLALSHELSADPELSYEEHRAAARCADLLEKHGFEVERTSYGLPTSFAARLGSGDTHVVICAEYDALPGVGHACGHNIIAASGLGAGIALAPLLEEREHAPHGARDACRGGWWRQGRADQRWRIRRRRRGNDDAPVTL